MTFQPVTDVRSVFQRLLSALFIGLFLLTSGTFAQDSLGAGFGGDSGVSFSPLGFGVNLDSGDTSKTLTANAKIAPVVVETSEEAVGYVSLQMKVADGWHIYTPTQGSGGKPTKIIDVTITPEDSGLKVGEFKLATKWSDVADALGQNLEELFGEVEWVAVLTGPKGADLSGVAVTGTIDALACSEGEGGACVPQTVDFTAKYDASADVSSIVAEANKLNDVKSASSSDESVVVSPEQPAEESPATEDIDQTLADITSASNAKGRGFFALLIMAFFGGLILNVTPCVLPVVGLKILSFFEQAHKSRKSAFLLNAWYTLGVLTVFGVLACFVSGLSSLFTHALFQVLMAAIVFAMALSLMGVWELETPAFLGGQKSNELSSKEGAVGAVFKGIITTLLAIPCGAPLLSPTLNWASQQPFGTVFAVYLVIGLGMASPFLLAGAFPELLKFFPKPGEWMDTFRKAMGFFLLIAVVWIIYSAPMEYVIPTIACLFALWFACWNIGRNQWEVENGKKKVVAWIVSLVILAICAFCSFNFPGNPNKTTLQTASSGKMLRWAVRAERDGKLAQEKKQHWALFDRETLDRELTQGRIVAVDFTADWCMNCKYLEKTILHTEEVESVFDSLNAVTLTADWTNQDSQTPDVLAINELLDANGARQVPTLMIFTPSAPDKPIVLTGLYTKGTLLETLSKLSSKE